MVQLNDNRVTERSKTGKTCTTPPEVGRFDEPASPVKGQSNFQVSCSSGLQFHFVLAHDYRSPLLLNPDNVFLAPYSLQLRSLTAASSHIFQTLQALIAKNPGKLVHYFAHAL